MTYSLLIALGLLFLAVHHLVTHPNARIAVIVVAAVAFLLAAVFSATGNPWQADSRTASPLTHSVGDWR